MNWRVSVIETGAAALNINLILYCMCRSDPIAYVYNTLTSLWYMRREVAYIIVINIASRRCEWQIWGQASFFLPSPFPSMLPFLLPPPSPVHGGPNDYPRLNSTIQGPWESGRHVDVFWSKSNAFHFSADFSCIYLMLEQAHNFSNFLLPSNFFNPRATTPLRPTIPA